MEETAAITTTMPVDSYIYTTTGKQNVGETRRSYVYASWTSERTMTVIGPTTVTMVTSRGYDMVLPDLSL